MRVLVREKQEHICTGLMRSDKAGEERYGIPLCPACERYKKEPWGLATCRDSVIQEQDFCRMYFYVGEKQCGEGLRCWALRASML